MQLRPFQKKALKALASHHHVLVTAPTGSGKSLIFERIVREANTRMVLISPLIALARQHANNLDEAGIPVTLSSGPQSPRTPPTRGVWVMSPEKLFNPRATGWVDRLRQWEPTHLVVDECHCLWEWGRGFRPAFEKLPTLTKLQPKMKSLWLTATLPLDARTKLRRQLPSLHEVGGFDLPPGLGVHARQVPWPRRPMQLVEWVRVQVASGLVFVSTRSLTVRVAQILREARIKVRTYHAGMSSEERKGVESWLKGPGVRVVVCTSAFGMGMNYRNLGWVALWQAPLNLLSLAQTLGRAGRSHQRAQGLVLWGGEDFRTLEWAVRGSPQKREELMEVFTFLSHRGCRAQFLRQSFEGEEGEACGRCDNCLTLVRTRRAT